MPALQRLLFFVNPKAGAHARPIRQQWVRQRLGPKFTLKWLLWEKGMDGTALIRAALTGERYDTVVAVGGDGTVNQVAAALVDTPIPLAIVPRGSGNGLARHLHIPLNPDHALDLIARGRQAVIDTAQIGSHLFVCTAGVGFDAHIGHLFDRAPRRGFFTYARLGLKELFSYRPQTYELAIDGRQFTTRAYLLTFGNATQWGNNAHIVPLADIQDGRLHLTLIRQIAPLYTPILLTRLFNGTLHRSRYVETLTGRTIVVRPHQPGFYHYDGEPEVIPERLKIQIHPRSLKVIIPLDMG